MTSRESRIYDISTFSSPRFQRRRGRGERRGRRAKRGVKGGGRVLESFSNLQIFQLPESFWRLRRGSAPPGGRPSVETQTPHVTLSAVTLPGPSSVRSRPLTHALVQPYRRKWKSRRPIRANQRLPGGGSVTLSC